MDKNTVSGRLALYGMCEKHLLRTSHDYKFGICQYLQFHSDTSPEDFSDTFPEIMLFKPFSATMGDYWWTPHDSWVRINALRKAMEACKALIAG